MTLHSQRRFASVSDVSKLLGLPRSTIYDRARDKRLPGVVRVGQRILFDLEKLERWLEAGGDYAEPEAA